MNVGLYCRADNIANITRVRLTNDVERQSREADSIIGRYSRRNPIWADTRYSPLSPSVYLSMQERERALARLFSRLGSRVETLSVLEIGCGTGGNLAELIKIGFTPERLNGIDLLEERISLARRRLPSGVTLICGDASCAALPESDYDVVYVSTVFSSILDDRVQELLAQRMWSLVRAGGFVLWYDFVFDNPRNKDVRGVPVRRIRSIFPEGCLRGERITLAPPISRFVVRLHPTLYPLFNCLPFLRSHVLCEIKKTRGLTT